MPLWMCKYLFESLLSRLLDTYPEMHLLDHMAVLCVSRTGSHSGCTVYVPSSHAHGVLPSRWPSPPSGAAANCLHHGVHEHLLKAKWNNACKALGELLYYSCDHIQKGLGPLRSSWHLWELPHLPADTCLPVKELCFALWWQQAHSSPYRGGFPTLEQHKPRCSRPS